MKQTRAIGLYVLSAAAWIVVLPNSALSAQKHATMAVKVATPSKGATERSISGADMTAAMRKFAKLNDRKQKAVLDEVRAAVKRIEDPYLRSLLAYSAAGGKSDTPRYKPLKVSKRKMRSATSVAASVSLVAQLPFRPRCEFRFAYGDIAAREPVPSKRGTSKRKKRRARMLAELEDLLAGHAIDSGYALAALLRELDNDRSADDHAVFLDSWRNGAETFYQALERTAGSGKGVFCYDAMLSDWVRRCVPKSSEDRKTLIRSMDNTQAAFYQTAATYRAYRSVRELVALSLILPPDVRLPELLAKRYEDNGGNAYSTRDVIDLILAAHDGDVAATVRTILSHLERMPPVPWNPGFNSVQGLYDAQDALMPKINAGGRHSDLVLAEQKSSRKMLRDTIARTARLAFLRSIGRSIGQKRS
jgi:hypothetical protein